MNESIKTGRCQHVTGWLTDWLTMPKNFPGTDAIQWFGSFLSITGSNPSVCKSNRLPVDVLRFSFIKLRYILWIPLKWSRVFLQSWTSPGYFSNSTGSYVTNCRFSPNIARCHGRGHGNVSEKQGGRRWKRTTGLWHGRHQWRAQLPMSDMSKVD